MRKFLISIAVLFLIVIVSIYAFLGFSKQDIQKSLVAKLNSSINGKISFSEASLKVFPTLKLVLNDAKIVHENNVEFLKAKKLSLVLPVKSLISSPKINLVFTKLNLNYVDSGKDNSVNRIFKNSDKEVEIKKKDSSKKNFVSRYFEKKTNNSQISLLVEDSNINYQNPAASYYFQNVNLKVSNLLFNYKSSVEFKGIFNKNNFNFSTVVYPVSDSDKLIKSLNFSFPGVKGLLTGELSLGKVISGNPKINIEYLNIDQLTNSLASKAKKNNENTSETSEVVKNSNLYSLFSKLDLAVKSFASSSLAKKLNINIDLSVKKIEVMGAPFSSFLAKVIVNKSKAEISKLKLNFFEGEINGGFSQGLSPRNLSFSSNVNAKNFNIEKFNSYFFKKYEKIISGLANGSMSFAVPSFSKRNINSGLNGFLKFKLEKGKLNLKFAEDLSKNILKIKPLLGLAKLKDKNIDIDKLYNKLESNRDFSGEFKEFVLDSKFVSNGLKINNLVTVYKLNSGKDIFKRLQSTGNIYFDNTLKLNSNLFVEDEKFKNYNFMGNYNAETKEMKIPFIISGNISNPRFDFSSTIKSYKQAAVKTQTEKLKNKAKAKIKEKILEKTGGKAKEFLDKIKLPF